MALCCVDALSECDGCMRCDTDDEPFEGGDADWRLREAILMRYGVWKEG